MTELISQKLRLDVLLVSRGFLVSREQARKAILAGAVRVNGVLARKTSLLVDENSELSVASEGQARFVSRGGEKLSDALDVFGVNVQGRVCLDGGISTGGFTDCLLQRGARVVYGVDVGHAQLSVSLQSDPRIRLKEKLNLRSARCEDVYDVSAPLADLAVVDVSFISLTLVLPALVNLLRSPFEMVLLIKPQFEVGKGNVGKGGIVTDPVLQATAIQKVLDCANLLKLRFCGLMRSSLVGGDGNQEFLCCLKSSSLEGESSRQGAASPNFEAIRSWLTSGSSAQVLSE